MHRQAEIGAQEILALRVGDGSTDNSNYPPSSLQGHWSPDPLNPGETALGASWGNVSPFAIKDANALLAPPPPDLDSPEYAAAYVAAHITTLRWV